MSILLKNRSNIFFLILELWRFLEKKRKNELKLVLFLVLISSLIEIFCLASVIPFLSLLSNSEAIVQNIYLKIPLLEIFELKNLIYLITITFIVLNLMAGFFRIITLKLSTDVAAKIGVDTSLQIYRKILYQNYLKEINTP